jgi:hypothetical protein
LQIPAFKFTRFWLKVLIILGTFAAFIVIYQLLENNEIYSNTLGKITLNYERVDSNKNSFIREANVPFARFNEKDAINWDAKYYSAIKDSMYASNLTTVIYRYAFFPFFPLVWKLSFTNVHGIVLLNFLFFGISLILLSSVFLGGHKSEMFYFLLALLIPTSAVFYLPYTESTCMLTFSIALYGLIKKKYWVFFIAMICFSMTRPSSWILVLIFFLISIINLFYHKKMRWFLKDICLLVLPILLGWMLVIIIQYYYSGSWSTYIIASSFWTKEPNFYRYTSDWSVEGFGMTAFAIFAVIMPSCVFGIFWGVSAILGKQKENKISLFSGDEKHVKQFLFNISIFYIMGIIVFNLLTNGYQINGLYRYTMASPFFFIILFQLPEKLKSVKLEHKLSGFICILIGIVLFSISTEYAAGLLRFKYFGLALLILLAFYGTIESNISNRVKLTLLIIVIIPCLIWHAYLFNMYLGNAWIFT